MRTIKTGVAAICAVLVGGCGDASTPSDQAVSQTQSVQAASEPRADGKTVYTQYCAGCHDDGANGAPALDDIPAWASRTPEWTGLLKQHATAGFLNMPPAGGNPALDDETVSAAVDHMVDQIMPPPILTEGMAHGRVVYQASCRHCHDNGADGAPVIGDTAAWASRSPNWHTLMEQHAGAGFIKMPARGGELQLFQDDVAAAVKFMVAWVRDR